jgi:pilus assembly protein CpaC
MRMTRFLAAAAIGLGAVFSQVAPGAAQTLRVLEGATSATLRVPMNRAMVVESDMLFAELSVANPAIADIATLSERSIYILGRAPGRTTMTLLSAEGALIANVEIQVVPDVAELRERLREILPGEGVEVRTANDGIVLSGTVSSLQAVDRAVQLAQRYTTNVSNLMLVGGTQQVMLQVRFAEMQRTVRQELSTSLGVETADAAFGSNALGSTAAPTTPTLGATGAVDGRTGALSIAFGAGSAQIGILVEALESNGMIRTLAEPNLTALSGQAADFLAGGEYPIPVQGEDGIGIEFKPFGVNMQFTPTVVDGDIINLAMNAEVSSIGPTVATGGGAEIPSLNTRRASTTVELRDGESFAIAGLLQDDFRDTVGQVPWLGDLPILGALFRSASYQREQTELVIIITAHLVNPVRGEALALPTDRVTIPTEADLFLHGRTAGGPRQGTAAGDVAAQDFTGSYGYVME